MEIVYSELYSLRFIHLKHFRQQQSLNWGDIYEQFKATAKYYVDSIMPLIFAANLTATENYSQTESGTLSQSLRPQFHFIKPNKFIIERETRVENPI